MLFKFLSLFAILFSIPVCASAESFLDIYQQAKQYDPVLQDAAASRDAAAELYPQARAQLLPNLSANANTTAYRVNATGLPQQQFNSNGYGVTLTQPLLNLSSIANLFSANASVWQANMNYQVAEQDLIVRTANAYFNTLLAEDALRFIQQQKFMVAEQYNQASHRFRAGLDANTSMYNAEANYDAILTQETAAKNAVSRAEQQIRFLTGTLPKKPLFVLRRSVSFSPPDPKNREAWMSAAEKNNEALKAAIYGMESARDTIKTNEAQHLPTLNAVATYGQVNGDPSNYGTTNSTTGTIGLQLSLPLFTGGFVNSTVRQAQANFLKTSADEEGAYRNAMIGASQGYDNVLADIDQIQSGQAAVQSAQQSADSTSLAFTAGARSMTDVLIAEQNLLQAEITLARVKYNYILDSLSLRQATGILTEKDVETVNTWLEPARPTPPPKKLMTEDMLIGDQSLAATT